MSVKTVFAEEVKHRKAELKYGLNLTVQQRYVLRELRAFFSQAEDPELKADVNLLEDAFKNPLSGAIKRQLNHLRRNGVTGKNLINALKEIYYQHGMMDHDFSLRTRIETESEEMPRIICSEALL